MPSAPLVLAVNAGSSTLKFALYPVHEGVADDAIASGQFEGLAGSGALRLAVRPAQGARIEQALPAGAGGPRFDRALALLRDSFTEWLPRGAVLAGVAHRIVHGGERFRVSTQLDGEALAYLDTLNELAPLHQPHNLHGVRAFAQAFPALPQIGCFDTGFHATLPAVERRLPLPAALDAMGLRRYGFHGLSYRWLVQQLRRLAPQRWQGRWLLAHLGSGASLCAVQGGHSVATTMGFSALDGLMMGTRTGSLDPGVLLYLLRHGWDADRLERLLYTESGLAGVSGLGSDMRMLRASAAASAHEAIALFTRRIVREAGAMVACLGGLDGIVFTGGIGEHDAQLRKEVCTALAFLGVSVDAAANRAATGASARCISPPEAGGEWPSVWVIPTDEGRVAAQDAAALLRPA
ncbi:MAG: acetate/propionate family kinase [Burkholderiales bacterium]